VAQELLRVASIVGLEFALPVASDAAGIAETDGLDAVEHASAAGLVHEVGIDRYGFTHALVRDALAAELSATRRARLHAAVARAVETRSPATEEQFRALAHHYAHAGDDPSQVAKAFDYAVRSARRAVELLAFDAAVEDYATALELLDRLDRPARERFEVLVAKGEAERLAAAHAAALVTLERAADLARAERSWPDLARVAIAFEEVSWRPGLMNNDALHLLREAAAHEADLPPEQAVVVRASLGRAMHYVGHVEKPRRIAEEELAAARRLADPRVLAHTLLISIQTRIPLRRPDLEPVIERADELWDLRDRLADADPVAHALEYATAACLDLGDRSRADSRLARLVEVSDRLGSRFIQYVLMSHLQVVAFNNGDLDGAERQADATLEFGHQLGEDVSGVHGTQLFLIRREQDRLAELVPVVQMILRLNPASAMWRPGLLLLLAEVGMHEEAQSLLRELAAGRFAAVPHDNLYPTALCFLAETAARLGAGDHAGELAALLEPWTGLGIAGGHMVAYLGAADRYLGLLARLDGRLDDAARLLDAAVAFNRGVGTAVWTAHTHVDLAEVELVRSHVGSAAAHAVEARALAERHGLAAVARRVAALSIERPV
jgi:hypothetical protein